MALSFFKTKFGRGLGIFIGLFFLLFFLRLAYGYYEVDTNFANDFSQDFFSSKGDLRKNYASEKFYEKAPLPQGDIQQKVSYANQQKYEKTASIKSKTANFEEDEKQIRQLSKGLQAIIQYEQNMGNKGSKELHLLVGVNPEKFDEAYSQIQKIGVIKATEITKVDKTNEYRNLNAQKASLEKTLQSLNELKSKGGQIADFVSLHDKILEIETQLQTLGVELGNFDTENEFCSIKFSLYEGITEKKISLAHRIKVALEWTIQYFALLVFIFLCMAVCTFVLLLVIEKLQLIQKLLQQTKEGEE